MDFICEIFVFFRKNDIVYMVVIGRIMLFVSVIIVEYSFLLLYIYNNGVMVFNL